MNISEIEKFINQGEIELNLAIKKSRELKTKKIKVEKHLENLETAKQLVINLGNNTQKEIKKNLEKTVSAALCFVFGDEYDGFVVDFNIKLLFMLNKMENCLTLDKILFVVAVSILFLLFCELLNWK